MADSRNETPLAGGTPCVAGIDLSSRAIDIVKIEEESNRAEWFRFELEGASAWERTRDVRRAMPKGSWWDDVYLAAIETPFPDQQGVLRRVQGAVMACIPSRLLVWEANAAEWKRELGLKTKPSWGDLDALTGDTTVVLPDSRWVNAQEHFRDAYCIAYWAREANRKGIKAAA